MRFHPALGDPEGLNERERGLFSSEGFDPLPPAGRDDWLSVHPEPGQTFTEFLESEPPWPTEERRVIYLRPVGDLDEAGPPPLALRRFAAAFFGLETRLLPALDVEREQVTTRDNPLSFHRQLMARDLVNALARDLPDDAFCLMGLTLEDLYPDPDWNFVFGQASPRQRVGVYSFWRYCVDDPRLFLRRCANVLAHEVGHLFGIAHCTYFHCLMNGSNHVAESDRRPMHLCPVDLRKLAYSVGFDVTERYGKLAGVLEDLGLHDDAEWIRRQLGTRPGAHPAEWSP